METLLFLLLFSSMLCFLRSSIARDTIIPSLPLTDGQTIVSTGSSFELGFFHPETSQNRYLGIWHKKISSGTVVWVANRETPLTTDKHGVLKVTNDGKLTLLISNQSESVVWSSNSSNQAQNPVAQLLDSGNLVVRDKNDDNPSNYLWQSFDYPGDRMLAGMKLGWNYKTGQNWFLSSWKTTADPSPGSFTYGVETLGFPQLLLRKGNDVLYRTGSWNGVQFTGTPYLNPNPIFECKFVMTEEEVYFTYELRNNNNCVVLMWLNETGLLLSFAWNDGSHKWVIYNTGAFDHCQSYDSCGAYASCNVDDSPVCQCLEGFIPKSAENWNSMNWTSGCVRKTRFDCGKGEGFRKFEGLKLPDTRNTVVNRTMSLAECKEACLKNCACTAYAMADIKQSNGCLIWAGDLKDIRTLPDHGQDLYVKMASSELDQGQGGANEKRRLIIIVTCVPLLLGMLLLILTIHICKTKMLKKEGKDDIEEDTKEDFELPVLDFGIILVATNYFSFGNKLGEGGFGPVYKGTLQDGQEIAVKRLSKNSGQGLNEFKNEVILINKLQHRNLVKLLGVCIEGQEKMLIYEYMPNKSLDSFIFDQARSPLIDWRRRYAIICGIARGLVYLHQDSRLRIIHRDLKSSNILLDQELNPKISDFGLARSFGGDQSEANTRRVVGTYGYMSPEYAIDGLFSVKSDVFSFGVVMLEIVSGKRNRGFNHPNHSLNLLGHAWRLWKEGDPLQLLDKMTGNNFSQSQVLRCIQVGLLCVQQCPNDRPNMSSVVLMLESETPELHQPKHPGFFMERDSRDSNSTLKELPVLSLGDLTITSLEAR